MDIGAIERNLSPQRFSTYLRHAGNDVEAALALYQRNTSLGESLHGALQGLEVCLRNAFHRHLTTAFGTPTWYDVRRTISPNQEYALLVPRDVESIREVRDRLIESKGGLYPEDPGLAATPAAMARVHAPPDRSLHLVKRHDATGILAQSTAEGHPQVMMDVVHNQRLDMVGLLMASGPAPVVPGREGLTNR